MNASIIAGASAVVFALSATAVFAQVSDKPFQENWAPSKWGKRMVDRKARACTGPPKTPC